MNVCGYLCLLICCSAVFFCLGSAAGHGFLLFFVVLCSLIFMYQYIGICIELGLRQSGFGDVFGFLGQGHKRK